MKTLLISLIFAVSLCAQESQQARIVKCSTTAGTANAQTCTATPTITGYVTGRMYEFVIGTGLSNTATVTINIDGVGAKTIVKMGGGITTALAANDIREGQYVLAKYDGTNMQMLSQLGNAVSGGGVGTIWATHASGGTSANGTSNYLAPNVITLASSSTTKIMRVPVAATAQNLSVTTTGSQAANCKLVVTLQTYDGSTLTSTALTATVSASAAAGEYTSGATTVSLPASSRVVWLFLQQNDGGTCASASPAITQVSMQLN